MEQLFNENDQIGKTSEGLRVVCMWILNEEERERSEDLSEF